MFWRKVQRSATRSASPQCQENAWLHAPAIRAEESAKNLSRHEPEGHRPRYSAKQPRESEVGGVNAPLRSTCHGRLVKNRFCSWRCHCYENEIPNPVPTSVDRYALRALVFAQGQQPGECWLCEADQRAEVRRRTEVTSSRRWLSVSRRTCVLQCSDGGATPGCDATWSLQARRQTRRRATANCDSSHQRSVNATRNRPYCK